MCVSTVVLVRADLPSASFGGGVEIKRRYLYSVLFLLRAKEATLAGKLLTVFAAFMEKEVNGKYRLRDNRILLL